MAVAKHKRVSLTIETKLEVLKRLDEGVSLAAVALISMELERLQCMS